MISRCYLQCICCAICLLLYGANAFAETSPESGIFTFGIVPQQRPDRLERVWQPLIKYLNQKTHYTLQFATDPTIDHFHKSALQGYYDFIYINPYHYTLANKNIGYTAIAKEQGKTLRGIIVTKTDSGFLDIYDLNNREIAFPSSQAFAASMLIRAQLKSLGINFTPHYVGSHDGVYMSILRNKWVAGGGVMRSWEMFSDRSVLRKRLKILWETDQFTPHAIAAHPRVAKPIVQDVLKALLAMNQSENGKRLLKDVNLPILEAAQDSDWDSVRALDFGN